MGLSLLGPLQHTAISPRLTISALGAVLLFGLPASVPTVQAKVPNTVPDVGTVAVTALAGQPAKSAKHKSSQANPIRYMHPDALAAAKQAAAGAQPQAGAATTSSPATASLFNGLNQPGLSASDEGNGATPPDSTGAIGPNNYIEMVNQLVGVYDRNLTKISSSDLGSFVGVPSGVTSTDPQVQWDPQSNRWLYAEIGFASGNNYIVFGWTKTSDPTDLANGWCHYGIFTGHNIEDYPKLGHDAHFLIIGTNVYDDGTNFPFITADVWAIPKPAANDSTCSSPVSATHFADATHLLKNTDGTLAFTPIPANATDAVTNDYIFGAHDSTLAPQSKVMVWHMQANPAPVLVADGDVSVGSFATPASAPQPGTTYQLDTLDGRLTQVVAHFDPVAGAEAFWTQHTIAGPGKRSVVQWYELAPSLASPIVQQGTVSSNTDFIWNAAISPSINGSDAAIFYNRGSASQLSLIGAQSRTKTTPAGQMDPGEVVLGTSQAANQENAFQGNCTSNPCRWGDYSGATPDPNNAGVVWGTNQIDGPAFLGFAQWTTQNFAISTGAPAGPGFNLAATPASQTVVAGGSTTYTVTIADTGGFTGPVAFSSSGLPAGATATFNPASTSGPSSTLGVATSASTPSGTYLLTVTGTSGSMAKTATATLVVQPVPTPDFALGASPSSQTVNQGESGSYTVTVTPSGGFTGSVTLSASGLPSGAGATFGTNPTSSSSSLTVTTGATTPAGTYAITVTGTSGSLSHSTSVSLTVQIPPDFTLSASPSRQSVVQGNGIGYNLNVTPGSTFTGSVTLSASGLPAGATASFGTNPTSATSAMWVSTTTTTAVGNYTLAITGTGGGVTHTVNVTLVVQAPPPPDFSLSASPTSQTVTQGNSTTYTITVTPSNGFSGTVTLSASGLPAGVGATFSSSTMTVTTGSTTPFGTFTLTVTGVSGSLSHSISVSLVVVGTCDTPTLTTSSASPYASGAGPVQLKAGGQCGGGTQYQFYYKDPSTGWHLLSAYSSSNTALWNADYAAGNYVLEVDLRPVGSSAAWVTYLDVNFTLTGCGAPTLSSDLASPQSPGTTVHWTASVNCSGSPQYQFWIRNPAGTWSVGQAWSSSNTFAWSSPTTGGSYLVQVNVRNNGANENVSGDNNTAVSYFLASCSTPTLTTSAASPYVSGAGAITLTAGGTCDGGTQFEFYYKDPSTGWHLITGYGSSNTVTWNADYAAGSYLLEVDLRPVGSTAAWVTYLDVPFTLTGCGVPTLTSDLASPQSPGVTVHWTSSVTCTATPQYQFWIRNPAGTWTVAQAWSSANTFAWTSPSTQGSYLVQVNVRNTGANDDPNGDNNTAVSFFLSSCDTPTLSTSAASPYPSGAGAITLTANGQCGGGTQYQFYYKDPSTGWHLISGYGSSNTVQWAADFAAGGYVLEADLRPVGSTAAWITYVDTSFTLTGCGVPSLSSDLPSPQTPGVTVHWTASVSCTGTPQYQFWVRDPTGSWSIGQVWGSSNTFTWKSPAGGGSYLVQVNVRNAGANDDPNGDNNTAVSYFLSSCDTPTLTTSAGSPYVSGSGPVQLTAGGQCGGGTQYQFYYKDPNTGWHLINAYGSSNTALWNADYAAGNYLLEVDLRPVGSTASWVTYLDISFTLTGCGVPTLTSDLASPQAAGMTVHWTATVACTGTAQYQFWVRNPSGGWSIVQAWSSSNTFTWTSPATPGTYLVQVNVRNAGANEDPNGDNNTAVTYTLT